MPKNFKLDQRAIKRLVDQTVKEKVAPQVQAVYDGVLATHRGRPVDEVKSELQRRWRAMGDGAEITDPELSEHAALLAAGERIEVRPQPMA